MRKILAVTVLLMNLLVGATVILEKPVAAKTGETQPVPSEYAGTVLPENSIPDTQASSPKNVDLAVREPEKKYPQTRAVEGEKDVVEFVDINNGFSIRIPAELQIYPLGVNPVAVLRGENAESGLRLAIDASAVDNKGPLMPFQVEAFREDFLRLVKSSVRDSANGKKILTSEEAELAGNKAVHVVSTTLTTDGKRRILRDEYVFVTQNRMFTVMYMMDEKLYPQYKERIPGWMESVQISQVWKKINIEDTVFSTEVPASCIDLKDPSEVNKTMAIVGNESIMIGLVAYPGEQFAFIPGTLSGQQLAEKTAILEGLRQKLATDTKGAATNYKGDFIVINGQDCVKATYEVNGSKNESYTFLKDGKVLELGFVYAPENEKTVRPVISHATEKLQTE